MKVTALRDIQLVLVLVSSATLLRVTLGTPAPQSPCHVTQDLAYHGLAADCTYQNISSLPLPQHWLPEGVTTLLLTSNAIGRIGKSSFSSLRTPSALRYLDLSRNVISTIEPFAFSALTSLQWLDLSNNQINLDRKSFSGDVFQGLGNLSRLELSNNHVRRLPGRYPDLMFRFLHGIEALSIDTFSGELQFGNIFSTTNKLQSLTVCGPVKSVKNDSFKCFQDIELKSFVINAPFLEFTEVGAMKHFKYLEILRIVGTSQTKKNILETLAPFVNRNMSRIDLIYIRNSYRIPKKIIEESIITKEMAKHLMKIRVKSVSLAYSNIFVIETGVLTNSLWRECLKSLDISGNPLTGEILEFMRLNLLYQLEYFKMTDRKYVWKRHESYEWHPPVCMPNVTYQSKIPKGLSNRQYPVSTPDPQQKAHHANGQFDLQYSGLSSNDTQKSSQKPQTHHIPFDKNSSHSSNIQYYLPKNLKILKVNSFSESMFQLDKNVLITGADNIEELHMADNGLHRFTGFIRGLVNLKLFDISRNNASIMSPSFFDSIPSIRNLNMAHINLQQTFVADFSSRLFKNLTELRCLDISHNNIQYLAADIFAVNPKLALLVLTGNRFRSLPFRLRHLPNLCLLDLRKNSIRFLSERDINELEIQAHAVQSFSLYLEGNNIFCGCSSIRFLAWLRRTRINLDNDGNYSCLSDSGIRTSTGQIKDLEAMWRLCHGQKAFWLSLVLLCMMMLCYISCVMISHFKTQIRVFFLKSCWTPFLLKTLNDYPIGVYIGYADEETHLACQHIRKYIEQELRLSTYVRHRDLLPASDLAESIVESVNSSWRVLLVVSQHFLDDNSWTYFLLKVSTFSVQADNPGRIVLVLTDDIDPDAILPMVPSSVLKAVQEENIITMTSDGNISYGDKQALKSALLNRA